MKNKNELNYKDLKLTCDQSLFNFENTSEVENITTGIGQERGIKALEFGLQVNVNGYNIYLEGPSGVGKTMYTKNYLNKISKKQKTPCDWCYIYNFDFTDCFLFYKYWILYVFSLSSFAFILFWVFDFFGIFI